MIPEPETIYIVDERATKRARRLVLALNDMEARGKKSTDRYKTLKKELDGLKKTGSKPVSGTTINVPRI